MKSNFLNAMPGEIITEEKVYAVLREWVCKSFDIKQDHLADVYRGMLLQECSRATKPFVEMIEYYLKTKESENYEKIVKNFITHYETFTEAFAETLKRNRYNLYVFCYISLAWTEVIDELHKNANSYQDMVACNIATQLQTDINRIVDEVFESKKSLS